MINITFVKGDVDNHEYSSSMVTTKVMTIIIIRMVTTKVILIIIIRMVTNDSQMPGVGSRYC